MTKFLKLKRDNIHLFLFSLCIGIISNFFILSNVLWNHDNIAVMPKGVGTTYASGRWGLGIINDILDIFGLNYNLHTFYMLLSIVLLGVIVIVLIELFEIENNVIKYMLALVVVTYPVFNATYYYTFTCAYYFFAILLSSLSALVYFNTKNKVLKFVLPVLLESFSIGIYQAYIPFFICLFLIKLILILLKENNFDIKDYLCKTLSVVSVLLFSIISYSLIGKLVLYYKNISLADYKGVSGMFDLSLVKLLSGIKDAYIHFFDFIISGTKNIFDNKLSIIALIILCFIALSLIVMRLSKFKTKKQLFVFLLLISFFPLATQFIYVMCPPETTFVYILMKLGTIFIILFPLIIIDQYYNDVKEIIIMITKGLIVILVFFNIYDSFWNQNATYIANKQANNFFTVLTSQIISFEKFDTKYPIAIIGEFDESFFKNTWIIDNRLYESVHPNYLNFYSREQCMKIFNGVFNVENEIYINDIDKIKKSKTFKEMSTYPNKNSIELIENKIVIKASN